MAQAAFSSNTTSTTFHIVADNTTVVSLIASVRMNCTVASNSSTASAPFSGSATDPLPEQAVQYYRASSLVLTLDGYNNTAIFLTAPGAAADPLPAGTDMALLACMNATIGAGAPLVDAPAPHHVLSADEIATIVLVGLFVLFSAAVLCYRPSRSK